MSDYTVRIFDRTFNQVTTLTKTNFFDLSYTNEVDKGGVAEFKIQVRDSKALNTNIKLFNRVKIYKGTQFKFIGYIDNLLVDQNTITVRVSGMLNFFKRRNISYQTGNGTPITTEFYFLLNNLINNLDDTGIDQGTSTSTANLNGRVKFNDQNALAAFQKLASLDNKVVYVNEDNELDLLDSIGSDKSGSIIFNYNINQLATANISEYDVEVDGKDMANFVVGKIKSSTSVKQDAPSIALFGRLDTRQNFSESDNTIDLDDETQNYLDLHKDEIVIPRIKPISTEIDPDSYEVGDTVKVSLDNGFIAINQNFIITRKAVVVSGSGEDDVDLNISPAGTNILPSNFVEDVADIDRRLTIVEGIQLE